MNFQFTLKLPEIIGTLTFIIKKSKNASKPRISL